jgi:hypothetical protein
MKSKTSSSPFLSVRPCPLLKLLVFVISYVAIVVDRESRLPLLGDLLIGIRGTFAGLGLRSLGLASLGAFAMGVVVVIVVMVVRLPALGTSSAAAT